MYSAFHEEDSTKLNKDTTVDEVPKNTFFVKGVIDYYTKCLQNLLKLAIFCNVYLI